jgi:hypothetical protein
MRKIISNDDSATLFSRFDWKTGVLSSIRVVGGENASKLSDVSTLANELRCPKLNSFYRSPKFRTQQFMNFKDL